VTADADGALTYTGPIRTEPPTAVSARQRRQIRGRGASIRAALVIITPTSGHLLATAADETIRLWDIDQNRAYGIPLSGHDGWVRAMTVVSDGDGSPMLLTGGDDGTLRAWDYRQGQARHIVRLGSRVSGLSTDGREIIASLDDGKIAVRLHPDRFARP
jgi:WD40 repeat protein